MKVNYLIAGGAGFIGSNLVEVIMKEEPDAVVRVLDNFSSGSLGFLEEVRHSPNLEIVEGDIKDIDIVKDSMDGIDVVYHFASNPDIAKAIAQPDIDFWEGTYLTNNILEAMRVNGVGRILYASGSGIYGDAGEEEMHEDHAPNVPISTYGASKLACEALICSYCHLFGMNGAAFRFANVVGPHQTHGVGYDFVRKLIENPSVLKILGDGKQSKPYIFVDDVISAMRLLETKAPEGFVYYNVATMDHVDVREISRIVIEVMGLSDVALDFSGGDRGWKGDIPVVRLDSRKLRSLGWSSRYNSVEAMRLSAMSVYQEAKVNGV